jgi:hypothetical protein
LVEKGRRGQKADTPPLPIVLWFFTDSNASESASQSIEQKSVASFNAGRKTRLLLFRYEPKAFKNLRYCAVL